MPEEAFSYLDNASTTKVMPEAAEAAYQAMTQIYGNPSSLHSMGLAAQRLVTHSRNRLLAALGDPSGRLLFTSGATEANNTAVLGLAAKYGVRKKRVVTTTIEHPSVSMAFNRLEELGYEVVRLSPNSVGEITEDMLVSAVDSKTCLISAMLVNNETGCILPIAGAFMKIKRKYPDCITHSDLVQGFLKLPTSVKTLCLDSASVSGHKLHAPKGVGALYIKKGIRLSPLLVGGGQEHGLRSGTEAVPCIHAMGRAVELQSPTIEKRYEHALSLNEYARKSLTAVGAVILSRADASPYILSIALPGYKSETLLHSLEEDGVYVSSGSACSKGKKSAVLTELKTKGSYIDSVLRISFSGMSRQEDIDALAKGLIRCSERLARIRN